MMRAFPIALAAAALFSTSPACRPERTATPAECNEILDRMVQLDMVALGFRDPELTRMKQQELKTQFSTALHECSQLTIHPGAMDCVRRAATTQELVEQCLKD